MNVPAMIAGLALLALPSAAAASPAGCTPTIENAWIRAAPPGSTALAGYGTVRNACSKPISLSGVATADFAMSMMHETVVQNGMSRMRHAKSMLVPARGRLEFEPGGRHLMLMHPKRNLKTGDRVKVWLKLADGRRIAADFPVRMHAPPGAARALR